MKVWGKSISVELAAALAFFVNGSAILCSHLSTGAAVCYRALIGDTARCVVCSHHLGNFGLLHTTEGVMLNSACPSSDLSSRVMRDGQCPNKGVHTVGLFTSHVMATSKTVMTHMSWFQCIPFTCKNFNASEKAAMMMLVKLMECTCIMNMEYFTGTNKILVCYKYTAC